MANSYGEIHFRAIPGLSRLFLDYVEDLGTVRSLFPVAPELNAVRERSRTLLAAPHANRAELVGILRKRNASFGVAPAVTRNIDRLESRGAVAVVTGQQLGLFGGPLYTVYKALTAIRLADRLTELGIESVPVFWMEGEDHDLAEVTRFTLQTQSGELRTADFRPALFGGIPEEARSVSGVELTAGIDQVLAEIAAAVPDSRSRAEVLADAQDAYRPGRTFAEAFGRFMARLFGRRGLILFDPSEPAVKQLAAPLFGLAAVEAEGIREALGERNRMLAAAGYHVQVSTPDSSTLLFFQHRGQRRAVVEEGGHFTLKGADQQYDHDAFAGLAAADARLFGPNVLLRPLIQDYLLPTAAYVAGPAEIAYFAQLGPLYRLFDIPMPAIWPRSSLTLVEPGVSTLIESSGLSVADCISSPSGILEGALVKAGADQGSRQLRLLSQTLERELELLRPGLVTAEASLGAALDTAKRKILHNAEALQARVLQAEAGGNQLLTARVTSILNACRPNGNLQERELNVVPFLAAYGFELLDRLYDRVDPERFFHHVLSL